MTQLDLLDLLAAQPFTLCPEHQAAYDAWLDPRQLRIESRLDYIGNDTVKTRAERVGKRADQWYSTVNEQLDLIYRICKQRKEL